MMKGILRPKEQGGNSPNNKLHNLQCSARTIKFTKSRIARSGGREIHTKYLCFILKEINATDLNDV
jgi:hypothetical protein